MNILRSEKFKKEYKKLLPKTQLAFKKKVLLLESNQKHPSLRIKRIQGTKDLWELSINMKFRVTFEYFEGDILFRRIGDHEILKSP